MPPARRPAKPTARDRTALPGRSSVPPSDPSRYAPSAERPVRVKARSLEHRMDIQAHHHDWGQFVFSVAGVVRVNTEVATFLVPPSRAVWIAPRLEHAVTAVEQCELRTLYLHQPPADDGAWAGNRVVEVSPLLRELVLQMAQDEYAGSGTPPARETWMARLVLDEIRRARRLRLGVDLPRDKRLRRLCEAMLEDPLRHDGLDGWAAQAGASARTVSRLFRQELGSSYAQWRQQALLAQALRLAAHKRPVAVIAAELGYASASAFSAMVTRTVGMPPSRFFEQV